MENHGTVYATRFKRMRESVEAMKEIWTKTKPELSRRVRQFRSDDGLAETGQKPRIRRSMSEALSLKVPDAPFAMVTANTTARGDLLAQLPEFHTMARDAGRDPASIEVTSFGLSEDLGSRLQATEGCRRDPRRAHVPAQKSDQVLPIIDRWTMLMQQVNG